MKNTLCLVVCMIAVQVANAQVSRDYYITENADTVFGEIKVLREQRTPVFRKPGADFSNLPPDAMRFYSSRMEMTFVRFQTSPDKSEFVVVEHNGPVKLYASREHYYFVREDKSIVALQNDEPLTIQERGQLTVAMKDLQKNCSTISDKSISDVFTDNGTIRKSTLLKVLNRYNTCAGLSDEPLRRSRQRHFFEVQLFCGIAINELRGDGGFLFTNSGKSSSVNFTIYPRVKYGVPVFRDVMYVHLAYKIFKTHPSGQEELHNERYFGPLHDAYNTTSTIEGAQIDLGLEYAIALGGRFYVSPLAGGRIVRYSERSITTTHVRIANGNIVGSQTEYISNDNFLEKSGAGLSYGLGFHWTVSKNLKVYAEVVHYTTCDTRFQKLGFINGTLMSRGQEFRLGMGYRFR